MDEKVSFVSLGGANFIGSSAYVFDFNGFRIGVDRGGSLNGGPGPIEDSKPLDHILLSHFHFDHIGWFVRYLKNNPGLKGSATPETIELLRIVELETIRRFRRSELTNLPFDEEDVARAVESLSPVNFGESIDFGGVKVSFDRAGHTLGAASFNFEFGGDNYYITNDISFSESSNSVVTPATKINRDGCRLLVRESTYINHRPKVTFEDIELKLVEDCLRVLKGGGQVVIPSLSDRIPHVFSLISQSNIFNSYPVYIQGAKKIIDIFSKYSSKTALIRSKARYFKDIREKHRLMKSGEPLVIIGTSGMLYPNTPSSDWISECLPDEKSAVFIVNYQEPGGQGQVLLNSKFDDFVVFNDNMAVRKCHIKRYNLSAHMTGTEGEELEERFQPETIVYVHGDNGEIEKYLTKKRNDNRFKRVKAIVAEEVRL